jgi:carboxyvinyl-carboxyphosphonate phosphorylmutase
MHWTPRRERFRELLAGDKCVHPGSVSDPISARIASDLGFEVGMFAGSVASLTVLGAPDLIVLTLSEFAGQAYRINRAADLSLLVDADHGYGNALNVKRTVEELETAGVAALSIEDTDLPQPFGKVGTTQLLSVAEGVGKMRGALAGRQDSNLVIAGRTSAPALGDIDGAIERGKAYQAAGVDALFFVGIKTREQLDSIASEVSIPLILGGVSAEMSDLDYLASRGVRVCLQGHQPIMAAIEATYQTLKALRDGADPKTLTGTVPGDRLKALTRDADYQSWMETFLR